MEPYVLRMRFDFGAQTCLWSMDDSAMSEYGDYGVDLDCLPISDELRTALLDLCTERDTALDWEYPQGDLLWSEEQQERFRQKAKAVIDRLCAELGEDYRVVYRAEYPI